MNISGLLLTYELIERLYDYGLDNLTVTDLKGLSIYHNYSWNGFRKSEFNSIISAFILLNLKKSFLNISKNQEFVFSYRTDTTEMDLATFLLYDKKPLLFDIEVKELIQGEEAEKPRIINDIKEQLNERINDHIPQLFQNQPFLVIGIVGDEYIEGYYSNGETIRKIDTLEELALFLQNCSTYEEAAEFLYKVKSISAIYKICKDIKAGSYNFYDKTIKKSNSILDHLNNNRCVVCYGDAGTGKTVIALKLFFENPNTKLLLLNSKFYFAMGLGGQYYYDNRTFYKTSEFITKLNKDSIAIVDEAQRLTNLQIINIVNSCKCAVFFGDDSQAFTSECNLMNIKQLKKFIIDETGKECVCEKKLGCKRYSDNVNFALNFLTSNIDKIENGILKNSNFKGQSIFNEYKVNIYCSEEKFLEDYNSKKGLKKIYVPYRERNLSIQINGKNFDVANYDDNFFSVDSSFHDYVVGHTFHAISFDIDHCFVYLDKTYLANYDKRILLYCSNEINNLDDQKRYNNELNVLFTRGRKSLSIYVKDLKTYLFLKRKVDQIMKH